MSSRRLSRHLTLLMACLGLAACGPQRASGQPAPLVLERTLPLVGVQGRIDHLATDVEGRRIFIAELGAGQVEALDLSTGRSLGRISGLAEPQGIAFLPARGEIVVATGGDGMARFYRADDLALLGQVRLGADADNVRVDAGSGEVIIGYGPGALARIDPAMRKVIATVPLPAHPEGFQLAGDRAWVNLPDAGGVAAVNLSTGVGPALWPNTYRFNFPLAHDLASRTIAVVYRLPARLVLLDDATGEQRQTLPTCGDADDLYFDPPRSRIYVVCGAGTIDVFQREGARFAKLAAVNSRWGARTGLFAPQLDRLFVAARAERGKEAAILVFRPGIATPSKPQP